MRFHIRSKESPPQEYVEPARTLTIRPPREDAPPPVDLYGLTKADTEKYTLTVDEHPKLFVPWSDVPPTEPGWYWYRSWRVHERHPNAVLSPPVEVFEHNGELVTSNGMRPVTNYAGKWAGPLPVPRD
jgi:hypothetical protein